MHSIVQELDNLINEKGWQKRFNTAITNAQLKKAYNFPELQEWKDYHDYLAWLNELVEWIPRQQGDSRLIYQKLVDFYFIVDQKPLRELQVLPFDRNHVEDIDICRCKGCVNDADMSPLSQWIVKFAKAWGNFMDTTESAKYVKSFKEAPLFNWTEYMPPPASYLPDEDYKAYRTFNQFFARHVKPGMRPVAGINDDRVLVAPADSTFVGWWQISNDSNIYVDNPRGVKDVPLNIKGIQWSIHDLLKDSEYKDRFKGGIFTHMFLN